MITLLVPTIDGWWTCFNEIEGRFETAWWWFCSRSKKIFRKPENTRKTLSLDWIDIPCVARMNSNAFYAELEKRISRSIAYPHDLRERMWRSWSENIGKLLNLRCINLVVPSPHPWWYHQQSQLANTTWERSRFLGKDSKKGTTNMFKFFRSCFGIYLTS